jgi:hypothetical protein
MSFIKDKVFSYPQKMSFNGIDVLYKCLIIFNGTKKSFKKRKKQKRNAKKFPKKDKIDRLGQKILLES